VIDACRDNPFAAVGVRSVGNSRGLARADVPTGVFVLFSAGIGQTALDRLDAADGSPNSVFTRTLVPLLRQPGISHVAFAKRVQTEVRRLAASVRHQQQPAFYDQIDGEIVLKAPPAPSAPPSSGAVPAAPPAVFPQTAVVVAPGAPPVEPETGVKPVIGIHPEPRGVSPLTAEKERALKPKDSFKECDACPQMLVVPAGRFMMGSPNSEKGREGDEGPQHPVTFARPFAVGKFAVTFDEWDACWADAGCGYRPSDAGWGRGRRPAIHVSWDDAQQYVAWLSHKTGKSYRLLSEAEREYVTRAGTTTPFWWGTSITTQQANYDGNHTYGGGSKGEYRERTVPVDSFRPNPWGLYQVHGNVWEWTADCWNDNHNGAPSDGSARTSLNCSRRVKRGGSWYNDPRILRAAFRYPDTSGSRVHNLGLRVGRTLAP
jgi:formylglycine-generating enzyme required for sulfatase activity